jgi:site-specific DNA-methyltransferase (adenine-specific)
MTPEIEQDADSRLAFDPIVRHLADGVSVALGDCRAMALPKADAVITDPPYGVGHKPGSGRMSKIGGGIAGDETPPDVRWMSEYPAVIWGGNNFCDQLPRSTGWLVWDKTHPDTCEHSQAEIAWTNMVKTVRLYREAYHGFMRQRDGWFHQHQKPPGLMAWCLQWTAEGALVLDPYMGSGTTGIACIRSGRRFFGVEIDPRHFETSCERLTRELAQGRLF